MINLIVGNDYYLKNIHEGFYQWMILKAIKLANNEGETIVYLVFSSEWYGDLTIEYPDVSTDIEVLAKPN